MTDPEIRARLAEYVRSLRHEHGLTREQLAERCDLSCDTIRTIERAIHSPSYSTLRRLCGGFGLKLSTFFEGLEGRALEIEGDERSKTRRVIPVAALEQARWLREAGMDELREWSAAEIRRSVECLLRECAAAQEAGVFAVGESVIYSDHGEPRRATVLEVVWFTPGRLRGYRLEVEGMGPNPVRLNALAFDVSAPERPDNCT